MTEHIYDDSIECAFVNDTKRERIVRCRDCKYLVDDGSVWVCDGFCANIGFNDGTPPDGFCAWAERRQA